MNIYAKPWRYVGLCGYATCGKDTIAEAIGWKTASFAAALKKVIDKATDDAGLKLTKGQKRPMYVAVGELVRKADPDYWIKQVKLPSADCIFSDARYTNEINFIHRLCGMVVRIHRNGVGPANETEARTIAEIDRMWPDLPRIDNDTTPGEAAEWIIREFSRRAMAA